jgi:transcription initiation factor TFIIE subunit alpha
LTSETTVGRWTWSITCLWTFEYDKIPEQLEEEMHRLLAALEARHEYEL